MSANLLSIGPDAMRRLRNLEMAAFDPHFVFPSLGPRQSQDYEDRYGENNPANSPRGLRSLKRVETVPISTCPTPAAPEDTEYDAGYKPANPWDQNGPGNSSSPVPAAGIEKAPQERQ
jgi:hypothetical protein